MDKTAISACRISPCWLIARIARSNTVNETEDTISICITATSEDNEEFNKKVSYNYFK